MIYKYFNIVFCLLFSEVILGQSKDFKIRYQSELQGDMTVIGNSIVNRKAIFANTDKAYNSIEDNAKTNDNFTMAYVNIDDFTHNFSSSSAYLTLNTADRMTIRYVGLYWTATYPYEEGKLSGKKYTPVSSARKPFDVVKVKFPNMTEYQTIVGEIIYDGKGVKNQENAPYVAYADITSHVEKLSNWQGEYFVANIRSAIGQVKGGVSAGWSIVFIYEKEENPLQKFISYDGFLPIEKKSKSIVFKGFKIPESNQTPMKLLMGALGADLAKEGSIFSLASSKGEVLLRTSTRSVGNFLNSSITENNEYVYNRKPYSLNTLGFDIVTLDITDENEILSNEISELTMKFSSQGTPSYLYMSTLAVPTISTTNAEPSNSILQETKNIVKIITNQEENLSKSDISTKNLSKKVVTDGKVEKEKSSQPVYTVALTNIRAGYYTILGAYSSESNAQGFVQSLQDRGIKASYFFNEVKKIYYIYESYSVTYQEAERKRADIRMLKATDEQLFKDLKEAWIMEVKN